MYKYIYIYIEIDVKPLLLFPPPPRLPVSCLGRFLLFDSGYPLIYVSMHVLANWAVDSCTVYALDML